MLEQGIEELEQAPSRSSVVALEQAAPSVQVQPGPEGRTPRRTFRGTGLTLPRRRPRIARSKAGAEVARGVARPKKDPGRHLTYGDHWRTQ